MVKPFETQSIKIHVLKLLLFRSSVSNKMYQKVYFLIPTVSIPILMFYLIKTYSYSIDSGNGSITLSYIRTLLSSSALTGGFNNIPSTVIPLFSS